MNKRGRGQRLATAVGRVPPSLWKRPVNSCWLRRPSKLKRRRFRTLPRTHGMESPRVASMASPAAQNPAESTASEPKTSKPAGQRRAHEQGAHDSTRPHHGKWRCGHFIFLRRRWRLSMGTDQRPEGAYMKPLGERACSSRPPCRSCPPPRRQRRARGPGRF